MKRACFLMNVKPEYLKVYKKHHQEVDPEMLAALTEAGFINYSLFLREDGLLVGYFESEDPKESMKKVGQTQANAIWQAKMAPFFISGSGDLEKGSLQWLEHVFYLE
jgi:L-rhamnose mutarotase